MFSRTIRFWFKALLLVVLTVILFGIMYFNISMSPKEKPMIMDPQMNLTLQGLVFDAERSMLVQKPMATLENGKKVKTNSPLERYVHLQHSSLQSQRYIHPQKLSLRGLAFDAETAKLAEKLMAELDSGPKVQTHSMDLLEEALTPVTALSSNHFHEITKHIDRVKMFMPNKKLIVYDLGLAASEISTLKGINFVEYRVFNFSNSLNT